ncbi:MAG: S8 family serine peptidase [Geminicoccaceae bacterium]
MPLIPLRLLAALTCWLLLLPLAARAADPVGIAGVPEVMARAQSEGRVRIIVELADQGAARMASPSTARAAAAGPLTSARALGSLPYAALEVDAAELDRLLASGAVRRVGINHRVRPSLSESMPQIDMPAARRMGATGAGQHIVVIDTGVRSAHPFLAGRVVRSICSAADCGSTVLDRPLAGEPAAACEPHTIVANHGTHVAGIAAGRGSAFSGAAPEAKLISIRVFACDAADWEYIIRALDYVATNLVGEYRIAAVNLSLGDDALHFGQDCDGYDASYAAMAAVIGKLRRQGIATVASSGNEWVRDGITAPACLHDAIAVGSVDKDDTVSWFSDSGPNLDLLAPGGDIVSSMAMGGFGSMSGTSMAAPHVAGAIAAIRSRLPDASIDSIEAALKATGKLVRDPENGLVRPRIDVAAALEDLLGAAPVTWHQARTLPGAIAQAPACSAGGAGLIDCVAPLAGGGLGWWRIEAGRTTGPIGLGGTPAGTAACLRTGADLHCFVVDANHRLARRTLRQGRWTPWQDLGGNLQPLPPACLSVDGRRIDCVAVGGDGGLRWRAFVDGSWAAGWTRIGAGLVSSGAPTCTAVRGRAACLVADQGADRRGTLTQIRQRPDGSWAAPLSLGVAVKGPGSCLADGERQSCFFTGRDGELRRVELDGERWGSWRRLGGTLASGPACVRPAVDEIRCLGVSGTGMLAERRLSDGSWQPWQELSPGLAAAVPACVAQDGRVDCLARSSGQRLVHHALY